MSRGRVDREGWREGSVETPSSPLSMSSRTTSHCARPHFFVSFFPSLSKVVCRGGRCCGSHAVSRGTRYAVLSPLAHPLSRTLETRASVHISKCQIFSISSISFLPPKSRRMYTLSTIEKECRRYSHARFPTSFQFLERIDKPKKDAVPCTSSRSYLTFPLPLRSPLSLAPLLPHSFRVLLG